MQISRTYPINHKSVSFEFIFFFNSRTQIHTKCYCRNNCRFQSLAMEQKSGNKLVNSRIQIKDVSALMHGRSCQHSSILFPLFINVSTINFFISTNPLIHIKGHLKNQTKNEYIVSKSTKINHGYFNMHIHFKTMQTLIFLETAICKLR